MAETLSVSIDTSKDVIQPSLEEEAAKYDEVVPQSEERPEWLPAKFKSVEDMAKAYGELEKKQSTKTPLTTDDESGEDEVADDSTVDEESNTADEAKEAVEKAGLNFDDLSSRYWEKGELDKSDYEALEKSGIPKGIVDQYIAGQEALLSATRTQVFNAVGGEDTYNEMTTWAGENLEATEVNAYNAAVNSGDMNTAMMAVKGLKARYAAAEGYEPSTQVKGTAKTGSGAAYRSIAELEADMGNPKYKTDAAFRRDVEQKLSRSDIM